MLVELRRRARRTVPTFVRTPRLLAFATVQRAIFLPIFGAVFGGAITVDRLEASQRRQRPEGRPR
jgi:hypothetical protein